MPRQGAIDLTITSHHVDTSSKGKMVVWRSGNFIGSNGKMCSELLLIVCFQSDRKIAFK